MFFRRSCSEGVRGWEWPERNANNKKRDATVFFITGYFGGEVRELRGWSLSL